VALGALLGGLFCAPEPGCRPVLRLPHFYFLQIAGEFFQ